MKKVRHKFNAKATVKDDIRFDSKMEARYYDRLKILKQSGDIVFFLRQVPFHLPGNIRYVVDFVEFWSNNEVIFTDVKGYETSDFVMKKKLVESVFPITINVVKKV